MEDAKRRIFSRKMLDRWEYIEKKWNDDDIHEKELAEDHAKVLDMKVEQVRRLSKYLAAPIEKGIVASPLLNPWYKIQKMR